MIDLSPVVGSPKLRTTTNAEYLSLYYQNMHRINSKCMDINNYSVFRSDRDCLNSGMKRDGGLCVLTLHLT